MDYLFEIEDDSHYLNLDKYSFTYEENGQKHSISYAQVNKIRMHYPRTIQGVKCYSATLHIMDGPKIHLKSYSMKDGQLENLFNHYNQFIRVFHIHLMNKSKADFRYGMTLSKCLSYSFVIAAVLTASFPLSLWLVDNEIIIYSTVPLIVGFLIIRLVVRRPMSYEPTLIPYHLLPGTSS